MGTAARTGARMTEVAFVFLFAVVPFFALIALAFGKVPQSMPKRRPPEDKT